MTSELEQYEALRDLIGTAMVAACRFAKYQSSTSAINARGIVFEDAAGGLWDILQELQPTIRQLEREETSDE